MRDYASLYSHLLEDLGIDSSGPAPITSDMDVRTVAANALAGSFYKKLQPQGDTRSADAKALKKFEAINASIPSDHFEFSATSETESVFYDYWRHNFALCFEPIGDRSFDLEFIREHMGVGPGASQKADSTYAVSKLFESTISYVHEDLIPLYRAALVETGLWADAERHRFDKYGFTKVRGGKLFFAKKNAEISRTCCTEPTLEMLFQKAAGAWFELALLHHFGISLSTQPANNSRLAGLGSIHGTFGTMDLVSASDSISNQLIQKEAPNCFLKAILRLSRCETAVLPDGREVGLRMISTMGNGFTFPLQTVIFASAVRAVYQMMGIPSSSPRDDFGVFGDDIIVRTEAFEFLRRMLTKLGFEVNVGKSFNSGQFRESCGSDYFKGVNVRGVYIQSLETPQEVYSAINRLTRWSANHGIPLRRTIAQLMTWVRDIRIPPSEADDAGICVPFKLSPGYSVTPNYWFKYRMFKRRIRKMQVPEPDSEGVINPFGIGVGYLAGYIRRRDYSLTETHMSSLEAKSFDWSSSVSIRDRMGARARYQVVSKSLPYWDYWPDSKQAVQSFDGSDAERVSLTRGSQHAWEGVLVDLYSR